MRHGWRQRALKFAQNGSCWQELMELVAQHMGTALDALPLSALSGGVDERFTTGPPPPSQGMRWIPF